MLYQGVPTKRWLGHAARTFGALEINERRARLPDVALVDGRPPPRGVPRPPDDDYRSADW